MCTTKIVFPVSIDQKYFPSRAAYDLCASQTHLGLQLMHKLSLWT